MTYQVASTLPLDGVEKYFCVHGGWMTIANVAHLTGNRSILISNASEALQCLLKRHPRMRTRIRVDNNRYFMGTIEYNREHLSSDLFFSTTEVTDGSWQKIVEHRCNQDPYSNDGTIIFPTFHFMLVHNSQQSDDLAFHLILFHNHCVSDGRSGFIVIHDFLTLCTTSNLDERAEPLNNEILPFIGQIIPRPFGLLYPLISVIGKQLIKRNFRQLIRPRIPVKVIPLHDCGPTESHVQRYKMRFLFTSTSSDLYRKLHAQCRRYQVTLHGPLFGCLLLAAHRCFPVNDTDQLKPFEIGVPFDMRTRLPQSPLTSLSVGLFIGMGEVKFKRALPIQSTEFWRFAQQCVTITQNQLKRDGIPLTMNIFSDVLANQSEFERIARLWPQGRQV